MNPNFDPFAPGAAAPGDYNTERALKKQVQFTPEEQAGIAREDASPRNLKQLDDEIRRFGDPTGELAKERTRIAPMVTPEDPSTLPTMPKVQPLAATTPAVRRVNFDPFGEQGAAGGKRFDYSAAAAAVQQTEKARPGGFMNEAATGLKRSLIATNPKAAGGTLEMIGWLTGSDALKRHGLALQGIGDKNIADIQARVPSLQEAWDKSDSASSFLANIRDWAGASSGEALGSMAPVVGAAAVGGVTGSALGGPVGGAVGAAAGAFGSSYFLNAGDAFTSARADPEIAQRLANGEITPEQVAKASAIAGIAMAALDVYGAGEALSILRGPAKGEFVARLVKQVIKGGVAEGGTEAIQQWVQDQAAAYLGANHSAQERLMAMFEAGAKGAVGGGMFGAAGSIQRAPDAAAPATPPATGQPVNFDPFAPETAAPAAAPTGESIVPAGEDLGVVDAPVVDAAAVPEVAATPVQEATQTAIPPGVIPPSDATASPGILKAFQTIGPGGFTNDLYRGLYDSLSQGSDTHAGVRDPILVKARPYYDRGEVKSPEDLRTLVERNFEPLPVEQPVIPPEQALLRPPLVRVQEEPEAVSLTGAPEAPPADAPATTATAPNKSAIRWKAAAQIDQDKDDLFAAIAKLGGLDFEAARAEWGLDQADWKRAPRPVFGLPVLRKKGGRTLDEMAGALHEMGYLDAHDMGELFDKFDRHLGGTPVFTPRGYELQAAAEAQRIEAEAAAQPLMSAEEVAAIESEVADEGSRIADELSRRFEGTDAESMIDEILERAALETEGQDTAAFDAAVARRLRDATQGSAGQQPAQEAGARAEETGDAQGGGAQGPPDVRTRLADEVKRARKKPAAKPETVEPTPSTEGVSVSGPRLVAEWGGQRHEVDSVEDAQAKWTRFRDHSGAGVSMIGNGVRVVDESGKFVARISYNGRVWDTEDTPPESTKAKIADELKKAKAKPKAAPKKEATKAKIKAELKQAPKEPAAPVDAKEQAAQDLKDALGELGDIFGKGTRVNITPEQEQKLLPVLTKLMDAAFRLGYYEFKDAARYVLDAIRKALGNDVAAELTDEHLQGAYIGMSGRHKATGQVTPAGQVVTTERQVYDALELKGQTEAEIRAEDVRKAREEEEARQRENAPPPSDFLLTGSNRATDELAARGQGGLFDVDAAAHQAATSLLNDKPEPSDAQKKAGNYPKGHTRVAGLDISIENPEGSVRSGKDANGKQWRSTLKSHYGYIRGFGEGADGDHPDVFVKPGTPTDYNGPVHVIDQVDPQTKAFDEHKVVLGVATEEEARREYLKNYQRGWEGIHAIRTFPTVDAFKEWLSDANLSKPAAGRIAKPKAKPAAEPTTEAKPVEPASPQPSEPTEATTADEEAPTSGRAMLARARGITGPQVDEIEAVVAHVRQRLPGMPEVVIADGFYESYVPRSLQRKIAAAGGAKGAYDSGRIFLFRPALSSLRDAESILAHEMLHAALDLYQDEKNSLLLEIQKGSRSVRIAAELLRAEQPDHTELEAIEEVLAKFAENGREPTALQRFWNFIRSVLRRVGLKRLARGWTDGEIAALVADAPKVFRNQSPRLRMYGVGRLAARNPIWVSQMAQFIAQRGTAGTTQEWALRLDAWARKGYFKAEELEWSGLKEWLATRSGRVSIESILEYLRDNGVRVEETVLGGSQDDVRRAETALVDHLVANEQFTPRGAREYALDAARGDLTELQQEMMSDDMRSLVDTLHSAYQKRGKEDPSLQTKFGQYTLPGGENYREVLLTLPTNVDTKGWKATVGSKGVKADIYSVVDADGKRVDNPIATSEQEAITKAAESRRQAIAGGGFKSSHFDRPNILAHVRLNDRVDAEGRRVLFVEELQSDWAAAGRRSGFRPRDHVGEFTDEQREEARAFFGVRGWNDMPNWQRDEYVLDMREQRGQRAVPTAPFVGKTEAWTALALKRVIRMAAEEGYDAVAWTSGEQQSERYDLSKHIDRVHYEPTDNGKFEVIAFKNGSMSDARGDEVFHEDEITLDRVSEVFGKDIADRMKGGHGDHIGGAYRGWRELKGVNLKVGGEGMKAFYDSIVPNVAKDVLKKLGGGNVADIWLGQDENNKMLTNDSAVHAGAIGAAPQPGFYLTDAMRERALGGMPLLARVATAGAVPGAQTAAPTVSPSSWLVDEPGHLDNLLYVMQDKLVDTKRVVQAIKAFGSQVADWIDPYLQEELYHGRTAKRVQEFTEDELKPLLVDMQAKGVTIPEFEQFLHARHAEERNKQIAKVNPQMPDGGSGMTTADARAHLSGLSAAKRAELDALAKKVDDITAETRAILIGYGLESAQTMADWENAYQHYVPLMREDMETGFGNGTGSGFSVRGSASRRATGSDLAVVNILGNVAQQRERAVVRGEKNRVAAALWGLAKRNPNPDFWRVDAPPKIKSVSQVSGLVEERTDPTYKSKPNVVVARLPDPQTGEIQERAVVFNERDGRARRMAEAIKNIDADRLGTLLNWSALVTRYFAAINTQYNPIFGVVNLMRDVQSAALNLSSTPLAGRQAEVLRNTLAAMRGVYRQERGKAGNQWSNLWEEFQREGGQTGYRDMFATGDDRSKAIEKELKAMSRGKTVAGVTAFFKWLSDYNVALENAVRLAAYKSGVDAGLSKPQAASVAKNLTVNFNRKGQAAAQAGALYAFFNASMQGTARLAKTLNGPAGRKIVAGGITLGVVQAVAMAMAGFDEDEPPEFVRERNLIIPVGGGKYVMIPMPLGLHVLPNIGRVATQYALSGFTEPGRRLTSLIGLFAEAFNPLGSAGLSMQTLAPTALDPLAALAENKDWTGKPIYREDFNKREPTPGFSRAKDTATQFSKTLAYVLNVMTGGSDYRPGIANVTPDQIDYLIGQALGGVGREAMKVEQTVGSLLSGEELPTFKIPLVGRLIGSSDGQTAQGGRFYANLAALAEHEAEIKGRMQSHGDVRGYLADHPEARLADIANRFERDVAELRKRKRGLVDQGAEKDQVERIEGQITARMKRMNELVKSAREGAK